MSEVIKSYKGFNRDLTCRGKIQCMGDILRKIVRLKFYILGLFHKSHRKAQTENV